MIKRLLSTLFVLCVSLQVFAYDFTAVNNDGDTIYYTITSASAVRRTAEVTYKNSNYNSYCGTISIPSSVAYGGNIYSVTAIGNYAFANCSNLISVNIPNGVYSIENYAFDGCANLPNISIPNSVTRISDYAFSDCSGLTSITIPNSVQYIGSHVFNNCIGVTTIDYNATDCYWVGSGNNGNLVFADCSNASLLIIGNDVVNIPNRAFFGCEGLTSVIIPNSVVNIGEGVFDFCTSLTSITIPNSVISIGVNPFMGCSNLDTIIVDSGNTVYDSRSNCNAIIESSTNTLISGCKNTTIPNSVTSIGQNAFGSCENLASINIPNSVTMIDESAFKDCIGLVSVSIPNTVTRIGQFAFAWCSSLTNITIPNSVTNIDLGAFRGCTSIADITLLATIPPVLGNDVFDGVNSSIPVHVPCGSLQSYTNSIKWSYFDNIKDESYSISVMSSDINMGDAYVSVYPTCDNPNATIEALLYPGYVFSHWSDGDTVNPRTITLTSDTTLIAYFVSETGIEVAESLVQIYSNENTIYINGAEGEALVIYDVYGRVIYQGAAEDNKPYEMPQPGVYMVKVGDYPTQKVVIKQ
ncbi:MAG: leucine-rich repeat domain-containing protein [Paludibacteraceae bacterium]|nr:leucine-rich repeat domain-containing protein [Paludibacteraceae bacterium]